MKRVIGVVVLVAIMAGTVSANMFTQTISFNNLSNPYWAVGDSSTDGKLILQAAPFSYVHDILYAVPPVDVPGGDVVTSATLSLVFFDEDKQDRVHMQGNQNSWKDEEEYVKLAFDGNVWVNLGEVDSGSYNPQDYGLIVDLGWLNDDGVMHVTVNVWNNNLANGNIYLTSSTLTGDFTVAPVPVPGAILLGMLGLGYAGRRLRRFV